MTCKATGDMAHRRTTSTNSPTWPSDDRARRVALPGVRFTLLTDRGVFSHGHVDTGTAAAPPRGAVAADDGDVPRSRAAAPGAIALTLAQALARRHGVGGRRQRPRPRPVPSQRGSATAAPTCASPPPTRCPAELRVRPDLDATRRSASARPRCTSCCSRGSAASHRAATRGLVVQKHLGCRLAAAMADRAGPPGRPASPAGAGFRLLASRVTGDSVTRTPCAPSRQITECAWRLHDCEVGRPRCGAVAPGGRSAAAEVVQQLQSSARTSNARRRGDRAAVGRRDGCDVLVAARAARSRRARRTAAGRAPARGPLRARRPGPGRRSRAACTTSWSGQEGLDQDPPAAGAGPTSRAARTISAMRLFGGPVAGREQLAVDVEERDDVGIAAPGGGPPRYRRRRPGRRAAGRESPPVTSTTGRPAAASSSSRRRVTPGRTLANALDPHAWHTGGRSVPQRGQPSDRRRFGRRRRRSARTRATNDTSGRPAAGPGPACCARTRPLRPGRAGARSARLVTSERFHGSSSRPVDHLDDRPAGALASTGRTHPPLPDHASAERGARRHEQARARRRGGPLDRDVAGVPGRRAAPPAAPRRARRAPPPRRGPGRSPRPRRGCRRRRRPRRRPRPTRPAARRPSGPARAAGAGERPASSGDG